MNDPKYPGHVTSRQALLGAAFIIALAVAVIAALSLLIEADDAIRPLDAPADETTATAPCPDPPIRRPAKPTAGDLIECPDTYDRVSVTYTGEAVRAVLNRGDGRAWVHLNDDPYALDIGPLPAHRTAVGGNSGIPVSIPAGIADEITHVGDYRHRGDIIHITGTFHRADSADGGGPTIQATTATIQAPGHPVHRPASTRRTATAAAMAVAVLALAVLNRAARRQPWN